MSKIKPVLAIIGIAVLLFTVVLAMTAGIANAEPTATRTLPEEPVPAGGSFLVEIEVSDYGIVGQVIETLPEGFIYHSTKLDPGQVESGQMGDISGEKKTNERKFTLQGDTSFTYTVIAPDREGTYSFRGILKHFDKKEYEVVGDMEIVVEEAEEEETEPSATRALPEEPVSADESFAIEIEASHYGYFGHVVETLPEGFMYEDSTLNPESVEVEDNTVTFSLEGEPSFTYTVTAPDEEGTYTFEGILIDEEKGEYDISGDTQIVVGEKGSEVTLPTNITAWNPIEAIVNNTEGGSRTFNITVNQTVNISWQINGTEVQTNESITEAAYTNASAVIGTWNVSAVATNTTTGLSDMRTWIWSVTLTPTITPTPAVNITSTPTPTPSVTPTPTSKPSPSPASVSTPTPSPPGFEAGFVFAAIFAVAYLLLQRKKSGER
ncbi:hypothetical protein C5S32_02130 [ANME-1 cluster archaeon GoMg1]|nr:hypothetical protein [ANME-1 cluster archaeon GoMg1]